MTSEIERADRADRNRARMAPFLGLLVLTANQWLFFGADWEGVGVLKLGLWLVLMLFVFAIVLTGGNWLMPKAIRALLDDEVTRTSRERALKGGFAAAMLMAFVVFVVSPFEPIGAQRAAHLIISMGLALALLVYGIEESRHLG